MDQARNRTLFELDSAALRIRDRRILEDTSWVVNRGEHWVIIGPNGAGKTTLLNSITGQVPVVAGSVFRAAGLRIGMVGPELYRRYLQDEARRRILWSPVTGSYPVTTPRTLIERNGHVDSELVKFLARGLGVFQLMHRPLSTLSTGEMRKVLLIAAMSGRPDLLLLDEPFDGLDVPSREWFSRTLTDAAGTHTTILLATHRQDEIVGPITRYALLRDGRMVETGRVNREGGLPVPGLGPEAGEAPETGVRIPAAEHSTRSAGSLDDTPLVEMNDVTVRYGGRAVLHGLNWVVRRGENWCVTGPNGSGKTTLLSLISGDHLQAYSNDIRLFGRQRGSGESIWDIKSHIGHVTPYLQARHDTSITARDVVLSGFFDSIGLYRHPTDAQSNRCDELMAGLGLTPIADNPIDRLSAGQRALVMIARAMVKRPRLLILDEPCDGLDPARRAEVLGAVEQIGASGDTDLIYVTHRAEEVPGCMTHFLNLEMYSSPVPA